MADNKNISYLKFPLDLLNERYNGNYVKINILVDSETSSSSNEKVLDNAKINNSGSASVTTQSDSTEMMAAAGVHSASKIFTQGLSSVKASLLQNTSLLATSAILEKRTRKLRYLASSILLPLPPKLDYNYGAQWNEISLKSLARATEMVRKATNSGGEFMDKVKNTLRTGMAATVNTNDEEGGDFVQAYYQQLGVATNQFKDLQFSAMNTREFKLDFKFVPKSKNEFDQIVQIIKMLKKHQHPSFYDKERLLLVYPDLFEVEFFVGGKKADFLPKYLNSALKDISVSYGDDGGELSGFKTFESEAPTVLNMNLTFSELVQLTRQDIEEGR